MKDLTIQENKRYLIAVSGGPDSMALFDMVRKKGVYIEAAHVNYHKRESALRDERIVKEYCLRYDIPFHSLDYDDKQTKGNFQASARKARYEFFGQLCEENNLDEVLVAHQEDDLIETYLMQKEKKLGVSYYGLREENVIEGVKVRRPLLSFSKEDLLEYCQENGVPYGIDESNLENGYERNRIRHEVIEKLDEDRRKKLLNEIEEANLRKQERYRKAEAALKDDSYSVSKFKRIPYLYEYMSVHFPHSSKKRLVEMKRQLVEGKRCLFIGEDICFSKEYGRIYRFAKGQDYVYSFACMEELEGFSCQHFCIKREGETIEGVSLYEDDFPVTVRNAQKGDFIALRYGNKKVNRFFIDRKILLRNRLFWPVMENRKKEVIFVSGIGCDINHYCEKQKIFMIKL